MAHHTGEAAMWITMMLNVLAVSACFAVAAFVLQR